MTHDLERRYEEALADIPPSEKEDRCSKCGSVRLAPDDRCCPQWDIDAEECATPDDTEGA